MSLSAFWSSHRPTILAIISIVTAVGAFTVLRTRHTPTGLRRSGAVHRGRTGHSVIKLLPQSTTAPLGRLCLWRNGRIVVDCNIATDRIPAAEGYMHFSSENDLVDVRAVVLARVIESCKKALAGGEFRYELEEMGLGELVQAVPNLHGDLRRSAIDALHKIPMLQNFEDLLPDELDMQYVPDSIRVPSPPNTEEPSTDATEVDMMDNAFSENKDESQDAQLRTLLYHIADEEAKRKAYDHRGFRCDQCNAAIKGVRWHCLQCYDYDLCSTCETGDRHEKTHVFAKVKIPTTASFKHHFRPMENWYPGDPSKMGYMSLAQDKRHAMAKEYACPEERIDALFDQFCCLVNTDWEDGPSAMRVAIDRTGFNKALHFTHWRDRVSAELLYARMFTFYDTDCNELISFEEFVSGLSYLRGPRRFESLSRAIQGFDVNADGFVDRNDFIQVLRAQFVLQSEDIEFLVRGQDAHLLKDEYPLSELSSSQPISSILREEGVPSGRPRLIQGKTANSSGDLIPLAATKTILEDDDPWPEDDAAALSNSTNGGSSEVSDQYHEMLQGVAPSPNGPQTTPKARLGIGSIKDETAMLLNEAILWQVLDDGLKELLDEMFKRREHGDRQALRDAAKLLGDRDEIEAAVKGQNAIIDELIKSGNDVEADSLHADARAFLHDYYEDVMLKTDAEFTSQSSGTLGEREPWLWDSSVLSQDKRETQASVQSLGGSDNSDPASNIKLDALAREKIDPADLTWPSEFPAVSRPKAARDKAASVDDNTKTVDAAASENTNVPPRRSILKEVRQVHRQVRELIARGGVGRLSLREVEDLSHQKEAIGGFVKGWLDWASF